MTIKNHETNKTKAEKKLTNNIISSFFLTLIVILNSGCENEDDFVKPSELPESLIGYQVVIHNVDIIEDPDNLSIFSRTVYFFEDEETVRGEGDDGSSLPTTSWEWTGGDPGDDVFDIATIDLFYEGNGQERFVLNWDASKEAIEKRQTFLGYYALAGSKTLEVEGYYEIEKR